LIGRSLTTAIAKYSGDYVTALVTTLEFVCNKSHLSILLHVKDSTTQKTIILLLQDIK
jgi:hypothetical protein